MFLSDRLRFLKKKAEKIIFMGGSVLGPVEMKQEELTSSSGNSRAGCGCCWVLKRRRMEEVRSEKRLQ